jgi:DNA (cytosine-5)-methyltransferase 1
MSIILDLFCGAGGAAEGYFNAGFDVVGVDVKPMPRFPFDFMQADALASLDALLSGGVVLGRRLKDFAAIHASPPCQRWSTMSNCAPGTKEKYPDLIEPVRLRLKATGLPYVIENVPPAPLIDPLVLCGSQFGLTVWWPHKERLYGLRRHRKFECSFTVPDRGPHDHSLPAISVVTDGPGDAWRKKHGSTAGYSQVTRSLMGINWMSGHELAESIPPVYTEYIGVHLYYYLLDKRIAA